MTFLGFTLGLIAGVTGLVLAVRQPAGMPRGIVGALMLLAGVGVATALFHQVFFYAEPGYIYHVRTITGEEKVISDVGYNAHLFGRYNAWKRAMTVQAVAESHVRRPQRRERRARR